MEFLRPAKNVPTTWWSADDPWTLKPRFSTMILLIVGLIIFGAGDAVLISARLGNTPWTVLAEGIAENLGWSIGESTFFVSFMVLLLWIPLREKPGIGTILNAILIAATIEFLLPILPTPETFSLQIIQVLAGIVLVAIGSGLYLTANLGPGPRDGTMTGLTKLTGIPIGRIRSGIEIFVIAIGWTLGGKFGIGTILFAILIGPCVAICLNMAGRLGKPSDD
ncbi:MAG: YczE/YyaS/YitT family protein [Candidatus Thalassarchaeaceae archaeon]